MAVEIDAEFDLYNVPNWDGYGASPITPGTVAFAREMLAAIPDGAEPPHIAPGGDGSIGLEWVKHEPDRKLFVDFGPGRKWSGYWRKGNWDTRTTQTATGTNSEGLRWFLSTAPEGVYS